MEHENYMPDVVDFAYQVINMHKENERLQRELEHYKKTHEMHCKSINKNMKESNDMTGLLLSAALNPESVINKGHKAILYLTVVSMLQLVLLMLLYNSI